MKLNKNSLHTKLYKFFWNKEPEDNLCPYFWKLLTAIVLLIPFLLFTWPGFIVNGLTNNERGARGSVPLFVVSLAGWIIIGIAWTFTGMWFINWTIPVSIIGMFVAVGCVIAVVVGGEKIKDSEFVELSHEFMKAEYNKYCPKINWKE